MIKLCLKYFILDGTITDEDLYADDMENKNIPIKLKKKRNYLRLSESDDELQKGENIMESVVFTHK